MTTTANKGPIQVKKNLRTGQPQAHQRSNIVIVRLSTGPAEAQYMPIVPVEVQYKPSVSAAEASVGSEQV